jgi:hypothetical protein
VEYLGFLFEIIFLAIGIVGYRFATGKIGVHNTQRPIAEQWRKENGGWLRLLSLALIAMMTIEILLHVLTFFKSK